ncbi:hypothetical protein HX109_04795 [Galbibacter sp. BG1]|uniref:DUF6155 family protein n=1 Tax=Galbibacter sp. BG1 TaxID=1170699 RepID=UPI0015BC3359|nr:DUF6155 family protein [Galbibacter sp. BG1]QLE00917.1 hypothetical protein HX109_04795 [Galbibacter sp. BG1]
MSKRDLKKYLQELKKKELEEQVLDLYNRFKEVKVYYDFVFNPKEDKLVEEAKAKISNEYFPVSRKRAKARRSVAHKYIKHFKDLGVNPPLIADVMWYNLEIAQTFDRERRIKKDSFYKSMARSFDEAVKYTLHNQLINEFKERLLAVYQEAAEKNWPYLSSMERTLDLID